MNSLVFTATSFLKASNKSRQSEGSQRNVSETGRDQDSLPISSCNGFADSSCCSQYAERGDHYPDHIDRYKVEPEVKGFWSTIHHACIGWYHQLASDFSCISLFSSTQAPGYGSSGSQVEEANMGRHGNPMPRSFKNCFQKVYWKHEYSKCTSTVWVLQVWRGVQKTSQFPVISSASACIRQAWMI